jgi:hypothetical protein
MAPNLTLLTKVKVINYIRKDKLNNTQVSRLLGNEGIKCSRYAVAYIIKKYKANGMIKNRARKVSLDFFTSLILSFLFL